MGRINGKSLNDTPLEPDILPQTRNADLSRAGSNGALYASTDVSIANFRPDEPMKIVAPE